MIFSKSTSRYAIEAMFETDRKVRTKETNVSKINENGSGLPSHIPSRVFLAKFVQIILLLLHNLVCKMCFAIILIFHFKFKGVLRQFVWPCICLIKTTETQTENKVRFYFMRQCCFHTINISQYHLQAPYV